MNVIPPNESGGRFAVRSRKAMRALVFPAAALLNSFSTTALLLVFGFSFADEHILELTKRAIRSNPKLIVLISCHTRDDAAWYRSLFPNAENVYLLVPGEDKEIGLGEITEVLRCVAR